ncbi:hypothetical protein [Streptomyces celluloflavus]|uniref:hypothetical protein n=1 Tax=Streptomyces celluloflavus TaxID=58344 RepID=UPI0036808BAE
MYYQNPCHLWPARSDTDDDTTEPTITTDDPAFHKICEAGLDLLEAGLQPGPELTARAIELGRRNHASAHEHD